MAIERTSATLLRVEDRPYTTLPNEVVQGITNPDSLAIWTYLQTMSTGWKVVSAHLKNRFNIGRDRYRAAMAYLAERGLISYVSTRNKAGHLLGQEIVVHHTPRVQKPASSDDSPRVQETGASDLPTVGKTTPLEIDQGVERDQEPQSMNQQPSTSSGDDEAFETFWNAGMRKMGKKAAKKKFDALAKGEPDRQAFADKLAQDVKRRLAAGQMGFDRLHPTTYLNQERWNDEVPTEEGKRNPRFHGLDEWSGEGLNQNGGRKTL